MVNKIIISIEGGMVKAVHSTDDDLLYVIVDWDNYKEGGEGAVEGPYCPDGTFDSGKAHEIYSKDVEILEQIKDLNF